MDDIMMRRAISPEHLERIIEVKKTNSLSNNTEKSNPDTNNFKHEILKQKYLKEQEEARQQNRKALRKIHLNREYAKKQRIKYREELKLTKEEIIEQVNYSVDLKNARLKDKYGVENAAGTTITMHEGVAHLLFDMLA